MAAFVCPLNDKYSRNIVQEASCSAVLQEERDAVEELGALLSQLASHWLNGTEDSAARFLTRWEPRPVASHVR